MKCCAPHALTFVIFITDFKVNYQRLRRNTLVGPIPFKKLTTLQCAQGMKLDDDHICFLSLRSLAMGDSHAVELAQTSHLGILIQSGLLTAERFVSMNLAIPRSPQMVSTILCCSKECFVRTSLGRLLKVGVLSPCEKHLLDMKNLAWYHT